MVTRDEHLATCSQFGLAPFTPAFPFPEPSAPSEADSAYRDGLEMGFLGLHYGDECDITWAGYEVGKSWRIRWGIFSAVTGHYLGSFTHREDAVRGARVLKSHFRPLPW